MLNSCNCIACETPRITQNLLLALKIPHKELFTYRDSGEEKSAQHLLERLQKGQSIALVSDAGTPTISDPGYRLIRLCREQSIKVVSVPGASAAISALSASGFPSNQFLFLGFLPIKQGHKQKILSSYKSFAGTLIIYESPYRVRKLLSIFKQVYSESRTVCFARELTKINEAFYRGPLGKINAEGLPERGEYVILVSPE